MRSCGLSALFSLLLAAEVTPSLPVGWKVIKDSKGTCQIAVPTDWTPSENPGSAVFQDATVAIAVVTTQPGQTLKPLSESMQKILGIAKDKLFENTTKRIYYQDKVVRNATDSNAFIAMVPGKGGTCSSRVVFLSVVPEDTAKKITLSVGPVPESQ